MVVVATVAVLASAASPALGKGRKPPKVFNGSYTGVNYHPPSVGLVTSWSGSVRFKVLNVNRKKRLYNYIGTGSVTYTFSLRQRLHVLRVADPFHLRRRRSPDRVPKTLGLEVLPGDRHQGGDDHGAGTVPGPGG